MNGTLYDFRSDNVGGAAPEILEAIVAANAGTAAPYGDDDYTRRMNARFASAFEHDVQVFPLSSGTGSNSIGLAALANPYGAIYCHETAHINVYECGAPEFFTGAKLGHFRQTFPPVVAQHVRLNILQANEGPTISEIRWIEKGKKK